MSQQMLAQTIADIAADLPAGHVSAWTAVLADSDAPSRSVEAALIDSRPGSSVAAHARRLTEAWQATADVSGTAIALALHSAAHVHQHNAARRTELVISGPTSSAVPVRLTSAVVIEVIRAARRALLVVSFAAYGVAEVVSELIRAADRGVRIDLVLESSSDDGGALRGTGAAVVFAELRDNATFWHWPAARRPASGNSRAALHAKIVVADAHTALISSANLTDRALSNNLEVGVVLHDPDIVERLGHHFAALMNPRTGPLERVPAHTPDGQSS